MRFITNVSSERSFIAPCAGCVLPVTYRNCDGQPNRSSEPYSVLRNSRPSSAGWNIFQKLLFTMVPRSHSRGAVVKNSC